MSTFAQHLVVNGSLGFNVDKIVNGELIIATQNTLNTSYFNLLIYSLADPLNPQLVSNTTVDYQFVTDLLVNSTGTAAFIPLDGVDEFFGSIDAQTGDLLSLDLSNASQPKLADVLFNNNGPPTKAAITMSTAACSSTTTWRTSPARRSTGGNLPERHGATVDRRHV